MTTHRPGRRIESGLNLDALCDATSGFSSRIGGMVKKKVLIADDSRLSHQLYMECLGDEFEYAHAYDGADALVMAVSEVPDLLLLDLMMPLLDGRTICQKLKNHPKTKDLKIIMVTSRDSQSDRLVGFEVGADDYIEKSCPLSFLIRSVKKQLP